MRFPMSNPAVQAHRWTRHEYEKMVSAGMLVASLTSSV